MTENARLGAAAPSDLPSRMSCQAAVQLGPHAADPATDAFVTLSYVRNPEKLTRVESEIPLTRR
ncbi:hypothetical protein E1267_18455 [Nonomuraea longispora]|uniref:Uncharacterized protein n=1 Tax=Nonomuraea longispora TaxID=1848320 RepID=A0A4R4NEX1_9ACTN|nr:hypothetical protein [Nonomuraea longispora]TDC05787.1 hypothetical protein E1267_18455 [Nonomuraea longispora]